MKYGIKGKTEVIEGEKTDYELEDKDFLLITAIQDLTTQLKILTNKL